MITNYPPTQRIWIAAANDNINDATLARLTILVPPSQRILRKRCEYEVLTFVTQGEWDSCNSETEMKKRIFAKFRSYNDAEEYAQRLLVGLPYYEKVLLRA